MVKIITSQKLFKFVSKIISELFFMGFLRLNSLNSSGYSPHLTVEKHKKEPERMKFVLLNSFSIYYAGLMHLQAAADGGMLLQPTAWGSRRLPNCSATYRETKLTSMQIEFSSQAIDMQ